MAEDFVAQVQALLGDRYTIERELGQGGGARVLLAREPSGRRVALKALHPELVAEAAAERFLREIRITGQLQHPNIAALLDAGSQDWLIYYTMTYVEGPSLRQRLKESAPLSIEETLSIARDVVGALQHAHEKGIIHRDVKPENIVLSEQGAVLLDFGIGRVVAAAGQEQLTKTGMTLGTTTYMSPEQILSIKEPEPRSDLYAVGCTLYECLTGQPPFFHKSELVVMRMHLMQPPVAVQSVRPETPAGLARAIDRSLEKEPDARWPAAADMRAALDS